MQAMGSCPRASAAASNAVEAPSMSRKRWIMGFSVGAIGMAAVASGLAHAADPLAMSGQDLYRRYCAACHGTSGEGNGPVASSLKVQVPDLTRIAQRQGG